MTLLGIARRLLFGVALFAPVLVHAQTPGPPDDGPPPRRRPGGGLGNRPGGRRPGRLVGPIIAALDTNHDGELSAEEIRNAAAALKSLDHNHDGIVDRSELEPRDGSPGGPGGPPDGPPPGGRFGGPPPGGPDGPPEGPPGGGRPPGAGRPRPETGRVLPPFVRDELSLTDRQLKQIAELENNVKEKLESILTADQLRQLHDHLRRGPGGPGPGEPPGGGPPDDEDGPPVRPQRPR